MSFLLQCLTAQELSNDNADIEKPLKALLAQFRMAAAKRKLRSAVKSPGDEKFLGGQGGELFAKGRQQRRMNSYGKHEISINSCIIDEICTVSRPMMFYKWINR